MDEKDYHQQLLLAVSPNDQPAMELIRELRNLGMDVLEARTLEVAARADEMAACIIVLTPGLWQTNPIITAVMRSHPRSMIPVLTEAMPLPPGNWTTEPVTMGVSPAETALQLALLINSFPQTSTPPAVSEQRPVKTEAVQTPLPPSQVHRPRRWHAVLTAVLLIGVALLEGALLMRYLPRYQVTQPSLQRPVNLGNLLMQGFSHEAPVPGPGCDSGYDNYWAVATVYKAVPTPTAIAKTNVLGTPQVEFDTSTRTACQADGLLVKHTDHFDGYAALNFAKPDQPLTSHFRTQVTGKVLGGSSSASLTLGVRGQRGIMPNYADGYGNDSIDIGVDGHWQATRTNNSTDSIDATFTQGFVEPGKTFTLAALVNGPVMTFFLNGHQLTVITDTTYPTSYFISFGITDPGAKTPPTALFSNFSYQELRASQITPTVAVATATAQAGQELSQSYTADRPGFHCDNGPGQWQPPTDADLSARCLTNGLALSESATAKYIGSVSFYGLNGNLPKNYRVKAQIDMSGLNGGCAGLNTRIGQQGFYGFYVCSDGSWTIDRYDSNGHGHSLAQGTVAQHSSYVVEATSDGDKQRLSLDGVQVSEVTDRTLNTTDHIELAMMTQQGSAGTAVLSHFVFTPLP